MIALITEIKKKVLKMRNFENFRIKNDSHRDAPQHKRHVEMKVRNGAEFSLNNYDKARRMNVCMSLVTKSK